MLLKKPTTTTTRKMGVFIAKDGTPIFFKPKDPKSKQEAEIKLAKINGRYIQGIVPKKKPNLPQKPKHLRRI